MKKRDAQQVPAALQWSDGLLLEPQHFQETARRSERLLDYHLGQVAPFHYGVVRLEIADTLSSKTLRVTHLEAVMPDGLVVYHDTNRPFPARLTPAKLEVDFKDVKIVDSIIVYLCVAAEDDRNRYDGNAGASADAEDEIGDAKPMGVARLVPQLRLAQCQGPAVPQNLAGRALTQRSAMGPVGFENAIPILQIHQGANMLESVAYEPPRLRVAPGSRLHTLCRDEIVEKLRRKAGRLAATAMALSLSNDNERRRKLQCERQVQSLVAGLPPVEALLDSGVAHPFTLYLAMSALVGQIAAASQDLIPPSPSERYPYDHEDLLFTFQQIREHIAAVCDGIQETFAAFRLSYNAAQNRYQVDLPGFWTGQVLGLAVRDRSSKGDAAATFKEVRIVVERDDRVEGDQQKRTRGATRVLWGEQGIPPRVNERLSEIALYDRSSVDLYWVDPASRDLQNGTGPFLVYAPADPQSYELTLYISYPPKSEK